MTILMRAQIRRGMQGIDTTVKSAEGLWRTFTPTLPMVMGHKNGTLSNAEYTALYLEILARVPGSPWDALASYETQTVLCYCRDGWLCHTHQLMEFAVTHYPDRFCDGRPASSQPSSPIAR